MSSHECPVALCERRVSLTMLMCRPHWYMIPQPLREAVWAAWDGGTGAGTPEHTSAIRAAIQAVNRKLASDA